MGEKYTEKLAKFIYLLIILAIIATICWYFKDVIIYIILAALVALLSRPVFKLMGKVRIKGKGMPAWLCAAFAMIVVFFIIVGLLTTIVPLLRGVAQDISTANLNNMAQAITVPLTDLNNWIIRTFPKVGYDFKIENVLLKQIQSLNGMGTVSTMVGSVTSFVAKLGIAVFAVMFISFFFIKNPNLTTSIVTALVPDRIEEKVRQSLSSIGVLVSRYFVGLVIEIVGVALINFLGLMFIARMGFRYSIGIAFMTGLLNIIPYIGPLFGGVLGVSLSLIIKYACATSYGLNVGVLPFILILAAIFIFTQFIDNYIYQPLIYSNSVKVHPLEIFIVFLIAGQIGGIVGMFAAIPAYTVVREIAKEFFGDVKAIRMLTSIKD